MIWPFKKRDFDKANRDPLTGMAIVQFISGALGVTATTAAVIYVVAATAITFAISYALRPKMPEQKTGTITNFRSPTASHEIVYGQIRKGGAITYVESTGKDNKYLHLVIVLAGHEVEEIGDVYLNEQKVSLDSDGYVTDSEWRGENGGKKVRIRKHTGATNQTADSRLKAESNKVDSSFRGRGIAYLYVRLHWDQDVFAGGIPTFSAVVKGKKVYDPRTGNTGYSSNPALCIRDYLVNEYGLNTPDTSIDDTAFSVAANDCDDVITSSVYPNEKRYEVNGYLSTNTDIGTNLETLVAACGGTLFYGQGKFKLNAGVWSPSVKTLTLDDLRSSVKISTKIPRRDNFNSVIGTFTDKDQDWISVDYPEKVSSTFLEEDNNIKNPLNLDLPMVTSAFMAQRLATLLLYRAREQLTFTADFGMAAFDLKVGDTVSLTVDRYGWDEKPFEVVHWTMNNSSDAGDLRVTMTLRETSELAFSTDNINEELLTANNTNLPGYRDLTPPSISAEGELRLVNQEVLGALVITTDSSSPFISEYEVQYKPSSEEDWIFVGRSTSTKFSVTGVSDGDYDFRARIVSPAGVRSEWTTKANVSISLFESPPQDVENFAGNVVGGSLNLTWDAVSDLDLSHYRVRYAQETSGATYSDAVDLVPNVARPATSVTVPARSGTYFIKAFDKLGIASENPSSFTVSTNMASVEQLNVAEVSQQDPNFSGSKTDVSVVSDDIGNYLTLNTTLSFDDVSGSFDDAEGFFDAGIDGLLSEGTYNFSEVIDLGSIFTSRVTLPLEVSVLNYDEFFDSASGLFDSATGLFDGDSTNFDNTNVVTQVRFTDDDPSSSPVWSSWQDFVVGDITARAFDFRVKMSTQKSNLTPIVRAMSASVDMPDRTEGASDITFTGSTSITFPNAFYATPSIGVAITMNTGEYYAITSKSRTGFTITVYDSGGSVSTNESTLDYIAKGYGKET